MFSRDVVLKEIYAALARENELRATSEQIPLVPDACLFGDGGMLDSFGLVSFLLDIEDSLAARTGRQIALSEERAMAAYNNPFRNVASLADYVVALLEGASR